MNSSTHPVNSAPCEVIEHQERLTFFVSSSERPLICRSAPAGLETPQALCQTLLPDRRRRNYRLLASVTLLIAQRTWPFLADAHDVFANLV